MHLNGKITQLFATAFLCSSTTFRKGCDTLKWKAYFNLNLMIKLKAGHKTKTEHVLP